MIQLRIVISLPLVATALLGCAQKVNPVTSNVSYGPHDQFATRVLDSGERAEVIKIMQESVVGPTNAPAHSAEYGVRWNDIRLAAQSAGSDLELAVLSLTEEEDGQVKRIQLVSVGEVPVVAVVRRVPPPKVYEVTATAGLFEDRTKLAADFIRQFDKAMRSYGAKPGWPPLPNE